MQALQAQADAQNQLDWHTACADSSVIRAHQHAAGAPHHPAALALPAKTGRLQWAYSRRPKLMQMVVMPRLKKRVQRREALGYSQGGFDTKIHLICDGAGRPLAATLSAGQAHESRYLATSLDAVRVPRLTSRSRSA